MGKFIWEEKSEDGEKRCDENKYHLHAASGCAVDNHRQHVAKRSRVVEPELMSKCLGDSEEKRGDQKYYAACVPGTYNRFAYLGNGESENV